MDTGFLEASVLRINTGSSFEFRRRTTCAPVEDNGAYVKTINISRDEVEIEYRYARETFAGGRLFSEVKRKIPPPDLTARSYDIQYVLNRECGFCDS